jgi:type II secretory pathway pseudopilin PulG
MEGFSLVELAVGLVIITLLLGMLLVPLGTQMDQQRISETSKQMDQIREAILGFAVTNGRLPCPATATTNTTTVGAGLEARAGTACSISDPTIGVVPWATLGVPETDAWGRRFTYRVFGAFADDPAGGASASFTLTDTANGVVTNGTSNIATEVPAIFVSHGKNGSGGYTADGTRMTLSSNANELSNSNGDATFVSRTLADDFDDVVGWVSPHVLKSRMVAGSRLP